MYCRIRRASPEDADSIAEIYNHAIGDRNATFDSFPVTGDRFAPFFGGNEKAAMLVAEAENRVVGWASISPISDRWAYRFTCLGSFYVHREFRGKKIGSALKAAQIENACRLGYHSLIVEVLSTNPISISLNIRFGFRIIGEIVEAGYRDGKWIGLIAMQRMLKEVSLRERQIRFSIPTDDITKSISFYRDSLGLDMRPICNAIAMFPLGVAEFEVCHRKESRELVGYQFGKEKIQGLLISLSLESEALAEKAVKAALEYGGTLVTDGASEGARSFQDFNGVTWTITVAVQPATKFKTHD